MAIEQCRVCGKELGQDQKCSRCGFPRVSILGEQKDGNDEMTGLVEMYRTHLLTGRTLSIPIYQWKADEGHLEFLKKEETTLNLDKLALNSMQILPFEFAMERGKETLELTILFDGGKESQREVSVGIPTLQGRGSWKLGVLLTEQLKIVLGLTNGEQECRSSEIDIL